MPEPGESLLVFPTEFPIKVLGETVPGFAQAMLAIVRKHASDFSGDSMQMRPSREGKYLSLTFTINATSRAQLDALYQELSDHPMVKMAL